MSESEMDRLANAVRADKGLQEEVKKAATSNEALVAFAKSKGYDVNLNEIIAYIEQRKATLSEEDLDKVAGGKKGTASGGTEQTATALGPMVSPTPVETPPWVLPGFCI